MNRHPNTVIPGMEEGVAQPPNGHRDVKVHLGAAQPPVPQSPAHRESTLESRSIDMRLLQALCIEKAMQFFQVFAAGGVLCRVLWVRVDPLRVHKTGTPANLRPCRNRPVGFLLLRMPEREDQSIDLEHGMDTESKTAPAPPALQSRTATLRIVAKLMKPTNHSASNQRATAVGTQVGAQVRANGVGHTNPVVLVPPLDDVRSHPLLADEFSSRQVAAGFDSNPPLREGQWRTTPIWLDVSRPVVLDSCARPRREGSRGRRTPQPIRR